MEGNMGDYLTFRKMITPIIIQIVFWIGAVVIFIMGIVTIANGGSEYIISGLVIMFFGPILWRVYCELLILMFRINETVTDIKNITGNTQE